MRTLRGFLGIARFFRRFVWNFAEIASPLTDLLQKEPLQWNENAQKAFEELKKRLATPPILILPDFTKEFMVETDALSSGIGAVLCQGNRPVAFYSKKMSKKMQQASTYVRELYAITEAIQK